MAIIRQLSVNSKTISAATSVIKLYELTHSAEAESEEQYVNCVKRLMQTKPNDETIIEHVARKSVRKNSWFFWRAAIRNVNYKLIKKSLLMHEQAVSLRDQTMVDKCERKLSFYVKTFDEISDLNRTNLKRPTSKRKHMFGLPVNWREMICAKVSKKYKASMLVMSITGCRPVELAKGITITRFDNKIKFVISGGKVKKNGKIRRYASDKSTAVNSNHNEVITYQAGQETRSIIYPFDLSSPLLAMLVNCIPELNNNNDFTTVIKFENKKTFASIMREAGKKLWPNRTKNLTPIMFRHQFASDNKNSGLSDQDQSAALGHFVTATKQKYGHRNQSKGGFIPVKIVATHNVKISKSVSIMDNHQLTRKSPNGVIGRSFLKP